MGDQRASYPMLLTGARRRALVVGGGTVARRKVAALLLAGIEVTVISPTGIDSDGLNTNALHIMIGSWPGKSLDLADFDLILAATNNREVNADVAARAREHGIPVNVADAPDESDFYTMGTIRPPGSDVIVSISTGGSDPSKTRRLREALEEWLREHPELL